MLLNPVTGLMAAITVTSYADGLLKTNKHDPDLPSYRVAMAGPHRDQFIEEMVKEVKELEEHGSWSEVPLLSVPLSEDWLSPEELARRQQRELSQRRKAGITWFGKFWS